MDFLNELFAGIDSLVLVSISEWLMALTLSLAMYFAAKRRNKKLSAAWYIFSFLSPGITAIVFLIKKRNFPQVNEKICPICGNRYPEFYQFCSRCVIKLGDVDYGKKTKQRALSFVFAVLFLISYIFGCISVALFIEDWFSDEYYSYRISVTDEKGNEVYYDKMGNAYENAIEVPVYSENGEAYVLKESTDEYDYTDYYFVNASGDELWYGSCFVDEDGWFRYDGEELLVFDEEYYESNLYYEDDYSYVYYLNRFLDGEGKIYYYADEASWNAEGELITAENDPTE